MLVTQPEKLVLAEVLVTQPENSDPAGDVVRRGARDFSRGEKTICVSASGGRTATATRDPKSLPRPRALTCDGHSEGGTRYVRLCVLATTQWCGTRACGNAPPSLEYL